MSSLSPLPSVWRVLSKNAVAVPAASRIQRVSGAAATGAAAAAGAAEARDAPEVKETEAKQPVEAHPCGDGGCCVDSTSVPFRERRGSGAPVRFTSVNSTSPRRDGRSEAEQRHPTHLHWHTPHRPFALAMGEVAGAMGIAPFE